MWNSHCPRHWRWQMCSKWSGMWVPHRSIVYARRNQARTKRCVVFTLPRWLPERKKWEGGGTSCLPLPLPFLLPLRSPSLAPFPSSSHFLAPRLLDSAPTSLEEGRGHRFDVGWSFVDGDVAAGGCRWRWDGGNGCCWV